MRIVSIVLTLLLSAVSGAEPASYPGATSPDALVKDVQSALAKPDRVVRLRRLTVVKGIDSKYLTQWEALVADTFKAPVTGISFQPLKTAEQQQKFSYVQGPGGKPYETTLLALGTIQINYSPAAGGGGVFGGYRYGQQNGRYFLTIPGKPSPSK